MSKIITDKSSAKIGWIGTGIMGAPMAMHLVDAGYNVSVFTRTKARAGELISKGCEWHESPATMAENCNVIFSIVSYPKDVEEVYFGEQGIFKSVRENTLLVDMSTTLPGLAVRIHEAAVSKGAWSVDGPVSGGQVGAQNGALSMMIGGDRDIVDQVLPIIDVFRLQIFGGCLKPRR